MRILSMTATFGKLEHATLNLESGLNIIDAPNEWGKSTWCAFLVTMLYGLDTKERTTKNSLADKERYAPWSGSPMSGRMDLQWRGRCITIERHSRGRTPMGNFRAYETETGLPVAELNATNCGQVLLGVERSVFARAGFLRSADMPVEMNEELRRRLNALVTTGDDSATADELGKKLSALKNRCRHNKTGLIPQLENRRAELENQLLEYEDLEREIAELEQTKSELEQSEPSLPDEQALERAFDRQELARQNYLDLERQCADLPSRQTAQNPPPPPKPKRTLYYVLAALCLALGVGLLAVGVGVIFLGAALVLLLIALKKKPEPAEDWQKILDTWDRLEDARIRYEAARRHLRTLQFQSKPDEALTEQLHRLHLQIGRYQGRMTTIGDPERIRRELAQVQQQLKKLEQTEQALTLALEALTQARQELQRRFAPGIAKEAQRLFSRLTQGRYDLLMLGQDLTVLVGAEKEDTLRSPMWRSEGTVDQLYMALRLAVAQELTPDAPLILDDALIRFDDDRTAVALEILRELSENKQVILFSCRHISA